MTFTVQRCNQQNETMGNFSKTWFLKITKKTGKKKKEGEPKDYK